MYAPVVIPGHYHYFSVPVGPKEFSELRAPLLLAVDGQDSVA